MNTKRVNAAAGVIHGSQVKGKRTAAGIAADLESACLLQSPETAAEQQALQARVDKVERAYVFDVAELRRENDRLLKRIAELEQLTPAPIQTCRICGAGYTYGEPCSTCEFKARMAAEAGGTSPDALTQTFAPVAALREDDPFHLHHTYRLGRDLPQPGGAP